MRYDVAVRALLARVGRQPNVLTTELTTSTKQRLMNSLMTQCDHFSCTWESEIKDNHEEARAYTDGFMDSTERLIKEANGRKLADQIPTFLLFLKFPPGALSNGLRSSVAEKKFIACVTYSILRYGSSYEVMAFYRSLVIGLLPKDLSVVTTAHIACAFTALTKVRLYETESRAMAENPRPKRGVENVKQVQQGREVAKVVAGLPQDLQAYFTIEDDLPLLRRLVEEVVRRLPRAGEGLPQDYVKTLLAGVPTHDAHVPDINSPYSLRNLLGHSSTAHVTRGEFCMLLPKIIIADSLMRDQMYADARGANTSDKQPAPVSSALYSDSTVAVITDALTNLSLLRNLDELVAHRELAITEWVFLIAVLTTSEPQWAAVAASSLRSALRTADALRRQRGLCGEADTIFNGVSLSRRVWLLRRFLHSFFGQRCDRAMLLRTADVATPLLWEIVRLVGCHPEMDFASLMDVVNGIETMWLICRVLQVSEDASRATSRQGWNVKARRPDVGTHDNDDDEDVHEEGEETVKAPASTDAFDRRSFLEVSRAILDVFGERLLSTTPALAQTAETVHVMEPAKKEAPRRGSGFARTRGRPPAATRSFAHVRSSARDAKLGVDRVQVKVHYYLEARMTHCTSLLKHRTPAPDEPLDALVQQSLRAMTASKELGAQYLQAMAAGRTTTTTAMKGSSASSSTSTSSSPLLPSAEWHVDYGDGRHGDRAGLAPDSVDRRVAELFLSLANAQLDLLLCLLRTLDAERCPAETRDQVIASFADTARQLAEFFQLSHLNLYSFKRNRYILFDLESINKLLLSSCAAETDDPRQASVQLVAARAATQEIVLVGLEAINDLRLSSARGHGGSGAAAASTFLSPHSIVFFSDMVLYLGSSSGLSSDKLPHAASVIEYALEALASAPRNGISSVELPRQLRLYSRLLYRMCILGVDDEKCLAAAEHALRCCGTDKHIKATPYSIRSHVADEFTYCVRILSQRLSGVRENRRLVSLLVAFTARMTAERLAFDGDAAASPNSLHGGSLSERETMFRLITAAHMFSMAHYTILGTPATAPMDRHLTAIFQYVKRYAVLPEGAPRVAAPVPMTLEYCERCEAISQSIAGREIVHLHNPAVRTEDDVLRFANALLRGVLGTIKNSYNRALVEVMNGAATTQCQRWFAHVDVITTLLLRFQDCLAPSIWHRAMREMLVVNTMLSFTKHKIPSAHATLRLALERELIYSELRHNEGTWSPPEGDAESRARGQAFKQEDSLYEEGQSQLIPYTRAARYLAHQQSLTDMDRREYAVLLMDRLVQEMKEIEGGAPAADATSAEVNATSSRLTENQHRIVYAARSKLLYAMRTMQV